MARRQRRIDEAKHEHWHGLLAAMAGLRARGAAFLRARGPAGIAILVVEAASRRAGRECAKKKAKAAFVPVSIVETPAIEIELKSGHKLQVRAGCVRQLLSEVVAVLEGRPC